MANTTENPFMDITNEIFSSKIYKTQDDFNFEIVHFHFLGGHIPHSPPTKYISSSLFLLERICSNVSDFQQ